MGAAYTLHNIDHKKLTTLPRKGKMTKCRVCSVYDGDTITVIYMNKGTPFKINIRIKGIDAPEMTSKNPLEKKAAVLVRDWLDEQLKKQSIWYVYPEKWDKYGGRVVGSIHKTKTGDCITKKMLESGIVIPYSGAKKDEWTAKKLKSIIKVLED